jgi:hypothetical protein
MEVLVAFEWCIRFGGVKAIAWGPQNDSADLKMQCDITFEMNSMAGVDARGGNAGESASADNRFRHETERHDEPPGFPSATQLPPDLNSPEQAHELDEYSHDDEAYDVDDQPYAADEEYQTEVPRVRRCSLTLVMAITGFAQVGTAGAFGYREIFRGSVIATPPPIITASNEPNKLAPASSAPHRLD